MARHKSAELLVARIRETVGEKYPVFCSGDFNSGAGSDPVEVMLSAFSDAEAVSQTPPYTPGWSYTDFGGEGSGAVDEKKARSTSCSSTTA